MNVTPIRPGVIPQANNGKTLIAGPWPNYAAFRTLPEEKRWLMYSGAKAHRKMLEDAGFTMTEGYEEFVVRVTGELGI